MEKVKIEKSIKTVARKQPTTSQLSDPVGRGERIQHGGGRLQFLGAKPDFNLSDHSSEEDDDASEQEEEDEDEEQEDVIEETPRSTVYSQVNTHPPAKRVKKSPIPRALLDEDTVCSLVKAYRTEFAKFCVNKKRAPKQIIPGKVWEKVYRLHYKVEFPNSTFEEATLKKHLRGQLGDIKTGLSDDGKTPTLQDEEVAMLVKNSDTAATRNLLRARQGIVAKVGGVGPSPTSTVNSTPATPSQLARQSPGVPATPATGATTTQKQAQTTTNSGSSAESGFLRPTKSEMLYKQSDAICSLALNFQKAAEQQTLLMESKRVKHQLEMLKEAKAHGIITDDEFKARLKDLIKF